jgi:serine/threonine protein kinase
MTFQKGVQKEVLFTVMELAENGDFYSYLNINFEKLKDHNHPDYPFSTELTRYYFIQLIEAVEYLHL